MVCEDFFVHSMKENGIKHWPSLAVICISKKRKTTKIYFSKLWY